MKKIVLICLITCVVLCSLFAFVKADDLFDVMVSDFKLYWNGNEMKFDSPTLLVNGQTYIPLRNFAEMNDMNVEWNGEENEIRMTERLFWFDGDIFFETIGWELPWNAEVINYAYTRSGRDVHLEAKIFITNDDIEYVKTKMRKKSVKGNEDFEESVEDVAQHCAEKHEWWDVTSVKDANDVYYDFMDAYEVKTTVLIGIICEANEVGGYYLYISC